MEIFFNLIKVLIAVSMCIKNSQCIAKHHKGKILRKAVNDSIVNTTYGPVRGRLDQTVGKKKPYIAFQGIPYAKPPINELRFEAPVPPEKWTTILNATSDRSECVQSNFEVEGSEDCLYINVYVPQSSSGKKLSTMVWIYGGGFISGTSKYSKYGPDYLLDEEVIFVSFNYRLGIFGFLSTGDMVAPGNAGLKDQILALKWTKQNIEYFGGDPNNITIFGESAGSASVSYLLQTPLAKGLFQGAIMQSGTSLCLWALSRRAKEFAQKVGLNLDVNTTTSQVLVEGLKKVDYSTLQFAASTEMTLMLLFGNLFDGLIIAPVIEPRHEGAIISEKSHKLLESGVPFSVPTMLGFNSLEGKLFTNNIFWILYTLKFDFNHTLLTPIDMNLDNETLKSEIGSKIKEYYIGLSPIILEIYRSSKFLSDDQFFRPIRETAHLLSKYNAPIYYYRFAYEGELGVLGQKRTKGVSHAEDLNYLFRQNFTANAKDAGTRSRLIKLWTNFAKYKNPTPKPNSLLENVRWLNTSSKTSLNNKLVYLNIGNQLKLQVNPEEEEWQFWKKLYIRYGRPPYDTY